MKANWTKKEDGGMLFIAVVTVLCIIAFLGVFSFLLYLELKGDTANLHNETTRRSVSLLTWMVIGIDLTAGIVVWLFKLEQEETWIKRRAVTASPDVPEDRSRIEIRFERADYLLDLFMMFTFLFIGAALYFCSESGGGRKIWMTLALLLVLGLLWFSKRQLAVLGDKVNVHKRGDLHDEAVIREKMIAYRSGYRTYKIMNRIFVGGMLLIMIGSRFTSFLATALFFEAGVLWVLMNGMFRFEKNRIRKKNRRKEDPV